MHIMFSLIPWYFLHGVCLTNLQALINTTTTAKLQVGYPAKAHSLDTCINPNVRQRQLAEVGAAALSCVNAPSLVSTGSVAEWSKALDLGSSL